MHRKYDPELKQRAARMISEALPDHPTSTAAVRHVADLLAVRAQPLRTWHRRAEVDQGKKPGTTTDLAAEIKQLERKIAELRKINEVLKAAGIFFVKEPGRPRTK